MAKVVFCNIAWMKFYSGITDNDRPKNGGAFVKENNDACESFNFYPYNHYCLGYVRAPGERLNLARVEDVPDDVDKIDDVTVIWVATNDTGRHIVGWYEHAEMYRYYQYFEDSIVENHTYWQYNFKTREENAYIIPEELRTCTLFNGCEHETEERNLQGAILDVKHRYGKNALMRGASYRKEATGRERNKQVGGHHA